MAKWDLIFWEPVASPHKTDLIRTLAVSDRVAKCTAVAQIGLPAERRTLGWSLEGADRALFIVGPTREQVKAIVAHAAPDTVHIFSGIRHVPCIEQALGLVLSDGRRFGIMSEPRASDGIGGLLRLGQSVLTEGRIRKQAAFVLAIGRNGPSWFRMVRYPRGRIFPFAYFLAPPPRPRMREFDGCIRVAYLGRLTRPKGIHLFLDAVRRIDVPISVSIAGGGPEEALVRRAQGTAQVPFRFLGMLPLKEVSNFLQDNDVLVVPSVKKDGWAAAASEALFAGIPVIATKKVGASSCLGRWNNGIVLEHIDSSSIARAVAELAISGRLGTAARKDRADWARANLTGEAGAARLLAILDHVFSGAPPPPEFPPAQYR